MCQRIQQRAARVMTQSTHENFLRAETAATGSDRSFGYVMACAFCVLAGINAWHHGMLWPWLAGIAALFLAFAMLAPALLYPLNRLWGRFGSLLHAIVNPLVMGVLFFGTVVPTGLLMRLAGKDPLRLNKDPRAATYWIARDPPGPSPGSMKDQF